MRRVDLGLLLFAGAMVSSEPASPAPRDASQPTGSLEAPKQSRTPIIGNGSSSTEPDHRLVRISSFDCQKLEEFPGIPPATGPIEATRGIRSWQGGGPNGANWNVDDLRCVVSATTTCQRGKVVVSLRVGRTVVARIELELRDRPSFQVDLEVPAARWRSQLEDRERTVGRRLPYRTGVFRASAVVRCTVPVDAKPEESSYPFVGDDSFFVAGFASGE